MGARADVGLMTGQIASAALGLVVGVAGGLLLVALGVPRAGFSRPAVLVGQAVGGSPAITSAFVLTLFTRTAVSGFHPSPFLCCTGSWLCFFVLWHCENDWNLAAPRCDSSVSRRQTATTQSVVTVAGECRMSPQFD